jgi:hypothetical protein
MVFLLSIIRKHLYPAVCTRQKGLHQIACFIRYNNNRGDGYNVQQVKDSGLKVAWTFNNIAGTAVAPFPTGDALTAFTATLDSSLDISTPDILSIENEEGNRSIIKALCTIISQN